MQAPRLAAYDFLREHGGPAGGGAAGTAGAKLLQSVINNLRVGQWAVVRASLPALYGENPGLLQALLRHLVLHPAAANCALSEAIPSLHHLAWLCALEHQAFFPDAADDEALPADYLLHLEFCVILTSITAPEGSSLKDAECARLAAVFDELVAYHYNLRLCLDASENESPEELELSAEAVECVARLLEDVPLVGQVLTLMLAPNKNERVPAHVAQAFEDAKVRLVNRALSEDPAAPSLRRVVAPLRALDGGCGETASEGVGTLLEALLASRRAGASDGSRFEDDGAVMCGLLSRDTLDLVHLYIQRLQVRNANLLAEDADLVESVRGDAFWAVFFLYATASGQHILERILSAAVGLAKAHRFEALHDLVAPAYLEPLRPLALLLVWKHVRFEPELAAELLSALQLSATATPGPATGPDPADGEAATAAAGGATQASMGFVCRQLAYNVRVANWCRGFLAQGPDAGADADADAAFHTLFRALNDSIVSSPKKPATLRILLEHADLHRVDDVSLLELLAERPADGPDGELLNQRDTEVLKAFSILKHLLNALTLASGYGVAELAVKTEAAVQLALEEAAALLASIATLSYRLEILEDVFAVLFLTDQDLSRTPAPAGAPAQQQPALFLAGEQIVFEVLGLVKDGLKTLQEEHDGHAGGYTEEAPLDRVLDSSVPVAEMATRMARLQQYVQEAQWRLHLVRGAPTIGGTPVPGEVDASVLRRMLASPDTLLTTCLRVRDYDRVDEVIKMFAIENQGAADAKFARSLAELRQGLSRGARSDAQLGHLLEQLPPLAAVQVCLDLAITSASSRSACARLLTQAVEIMQHNTSIPGIQQLSPVVSALKQTLEVAETSLTSVLTSKHRPLDSAGVKRRLQAEEKQQVAHEMLQSALKQAAQNPAEVGFEALRGAQRRAEAPVRTAMKEIEAVCAAPVPDFGQAESPDALGRRNYVGMLFRQVEVLADAAHGGSAVRDTEETGAHPLAGLSEGPMATISRLVFEDHLSLYGAEAVASQLSLSLAQILVRSCCRRVPVPRPLPHARPGQTGVVATDASGEGPSSTAAGEGPDAMSGDTAGHTANKHSVVLNLGPVPPDGEEGGASPAPADARPGGDPCALSHELLTRACSMLRRNGHTSPGPAHAVAFSESARAVIRADKEYLAVAARTRALQDVELSLLSDEEKTCFYCNAISLLCLHACIAVGPPNSSVEWIAWAGGVQYRIGSLGDVSVLSLLYTFLRPTTPAPGLFGGALAHFVQPLPAADPRVACQVHTADPRSVFVVWNGTASSPSPFPLSMETLSDNLSTARTHFLLKYVRGKGSDAVSCPALLRLHAADLFGGEGRASNVQVLKFVAEHLPAGSRTHSLVCHADPEQLSFQRYCWMPVCDLDLVTQDSKHLPSTPLSLLDVDIMFIEASQQAHQPRYTLNAGVLEHLEQASPLLSSLAALVHPPLVRVNMETGSAQPDLRTQLPFLEFVSHSSSCTDATPALHAHVQQRLAPLLTVEADTCDRLPTRSMGAVLLHHHDPVHRYVMRAVVDELVSKGKFRAALDLLDRGWFEQDDLDLDALLIACLHADGQRPADSWRLVARIRSPGLAAHFLFAHFRDWDASVCIDLLQGLLSGMAAQPAPEAAAAGDAGDGGGSEGGTLDGLGGAVLEAPSETTAAATATPVEPGPGAGLRQRVATELAQLRVYAQVLATTTAWVHWAALRDQSVDEPQRVVRVLVDARQFALAREWAQLHDVKENEIEENYVLMLLTEHKQLEAHQVLESLPAETAVLVAEYLLEHLADLKNILFVAQFLLTTVPQAILPRRLASLRALEQSATMMLILPDALRNKYVHLIAAPHRVVEQLLMNKHVDLAAKVLAQLPDPADVLRVDGHWRHPSRPRSASQVAPRPGRAADVPVAGAAATAAAAPGGPDAWTHDLVSFYAQRALQFPAGGYRSRFASNATSVGAPEAEPAADRLLPGRQGSSGLTAAGEAPRGQAAQDVFWVLDEDAPDCMICHEDFTVFRRRHHCRQCGRVVCAACSQGRTGHPDSDAPVRTCDDCFTQISPTRPNRAASMRCGGGGAHRFDGPKSVSSEDWMMAQADSSIEHNESLLASQDRAEASSDQEPWMASDSDADNDLTRTMFEYEEAPSITLSIAILDLYAEDERCGSACLYLCNDLSARLAADPRSMDHYLVISSIRRLLFNAKVKFLNCGLTRRVEECDTSLALAELLRVLLAARCYTLLSITDLTQPEKARRLRDRLIEDDKFELAMQVATKCRLDPFDVWSAWGIANLKLGLYTEAREKIKRCLQNQEGSQGPASSRDVRLLGRIVEVLEQSPCPNLEDINYMQEQLRQQLGGVDDLKALTSHATRETLRHGEVLPDGRRVPPKPVIINPLVAVAAVNRARVSLESCLDSQSFLEAQHYLSTYGSVEMLTAFLMRHGFPEKACQSVLEQQAAPKVFVDTVFLPLVHRGELEMLQRVMGAADPSLERWSPYLVAACKLLNSRRYFRVLYDMQLFMKDHFRAGITSVKFASRPHIEFTQRIQYLQTAMEHFTNGLKQLPAGNGAPSKAKGAFRLSLSRPEAHRQLDTVGQQIEVLRYFGGVAQAAAKANDDELAAKMNGQAEKNLFGSEKEKLEIAIEVLRCGSSIEQAFVLAFKLIQYFHLKDTVVFSEAAKSLARTREIKKLNDLLKHIQSNVNDQQWDSIIRACVDVYALELKETRSADRFTQMLKSDVHRIEAFMACGKLKKAYLDAVKAKNVQQVAKIRAAAHEAGNKGVRDICDQYLNAHAGPG